MRPLHGITELYKETTILGCSESGGMCMGFVNEKLTIFEQKRKRTDAEGSTSINDTMVVDDGSKNLLLAGAGGV